MSALPHFFVNMDKEKQIVSLKNQLSQNFYHPIMSVVDRMTVLIIKVVQWK